METTWFAEVAECALGDLRIAAYQHLVTLPMRFFDRHRAGELSSRLLSDLSLIQEFWVYDIRMILRYGTMALGGVFMMFVSSPRLACIVGVVVPLVVLCAVWLGKHIRRLATHAQDELARSGAVVDETFQAIGNVKAFGNEAYEVKRYGTVIHRFLKPAVRSARFRALFVCSIVLILMMTVVWIMWYGSLRIQAGHLSPGEFTRFMFYLAFAGSSGGTLAEIFSKFQKTLGANQRIAEILEEGPEDVLSEDPSPGFQLPTSVEVAFESVYFAYPEKPEAPVLKNLTFRIEPGQRVALVGASGAGKSTVVALLLRFYDPVSGTIRMNGKPLDDRSLPELRSHLAFVPQETLLLGGTVAENIAYGKSGANSEAIRNAARAAHAHEFITRLPEGYESVLGDRGSGISGGQRQRIAIARAILKDAPFLILDEATSSLDSESESQVQAALNALKHGRTTLIIAHRLSTVREADQILVLDKGELIESGTHDQLYLQGGAYRALCDYQLA
ncbi:MAG: ABC transporter transmembrane domain-containing protein [Verrucomicrobiota bacterium]